MRNVASETLPNIYNDSVFNRYRTSTYLSIHTAFLCKEACLHNFSFQGTVSCDTLPSASLLICTSVCIAKIISPIDLCSRQILSTTLYIITCSKKTLEHHKPLLFFSYLSFHLTIVKSVESCQYHTNSYLHFFRCICVVINRTKRPNLQHMFRGIRNIAQSPI